MVYNRFENVQEFYDKTEEINPWVVALMSLGSFFIYTIYWLFRLNKRLVLVDMNAPSPKRGLAIMILIPFAWSIAHFFVEDVLLKNVMDKFVVYEIYFESVVFAIFVLLSFKYFYDLCSSFGRVTFSQGALWMLILFPGFVGFNVLFFSFTYFYLFIILILPIIAVSVMQFHINKQLEKSKMRNSGESFNYAVRSQ